MNHFGDFAAARGGYGGGDFAAARGGYTAVTHDTSIQAFDQDENVERFTDTQVNPTRGRFGGGRGGSRFGQVYQDEGASASGGFGQPANNQENPSGEGFGGGRGGGFAGNRGGSRFETSRGGGGFDQNNQNSSTRGGFGGGRGRSGFDQVNQDEGASASGGFGQPATNQENRGGFGGGRGGGFGTSRGSGFNQRNQNSSTRGGSGFNQRNQNSSTRGGFGGGRGGSRFCQVNQDEGASASGGFGQPATNQENRGGFGGGGFGANRGSSGFGQNNQNSSTRGGFGQPVVTQNTPISAAEQNMQDENVGKSTDFQVNPARGGFGGGRGGTRFGQVNQDEDASASGGFGQPATNQENRGGFGGGGFGANRGSSGFGTSRGAGGFDQNNQNSSTRGGFGQPVVTQNTSINASEQNKQDENVGKSTDFQVNPARGGFGGGRGGTRFGQVNQDKDASASGGFGQPATNQENRGGFGGGRGGGFGTSRGGSGFNQSNQNSSTRGGFGVGRGRSGFDQVNQDEGIADITNAGFSQPASTQESQGGFGGGGFGANRGSSGFGTSRGGGGFDQNNQNSSTRGKFGQPAVTQAFDQNKQDENVEKTTDTQVNSTRGGFGGGRGGTGFGQGDVASTSVPTGEATEKSAEVQETPSPGRFGRGRRFYPNYVYKPVESQVDTVHTSGHGLRGGFNTGRGGFGQAAVTQDTPDNASEQNNQDENVGRSTDSQVNSIRGGFGGGRGGRGFGQVNQDEGASASGGFGQPATNQENRGGFGGGGFGANQGSSGFGQSNQNSSTCGGFGQPVVTQDTPIIASEQNNQDENVGRSTDSQVNSIRGGFGGGRGGRGFGQVNQDEGASASGGFGQPATNQENRGGFGGGGFGANRGSSGFGTSRGAGGFDQNNQNSSTRGGFGQPVVTQNTPISAAEQNMQDENVGKSTDFQVNPTRGGFGGRRGGTRFGQVNQDKDALASGGFGQPATNQESRGGFGGGRGGGFGANQRSSGFGQSNQNSSTCGGFGQPVVTQDTPIIASEQNKQDENVGRSTDSQVNSIRGGFGGGRGGRGFGQSDVANASVPAGEVTNKSAGIQETPCPGRFGRGRRFYPNYVYKPVENRQNDEFASSRGRGGFDTARGGFGQNIEAESEGFESEESY